MSQRRSKSTPDDTGPPDRRVGMMLGRSWIHLASDPDAPPAVIDPACDEVARAA